MSTRVKIPRGWRKLRENEIIRSGDLFDYYNCDSILGFAHVYDDVGRTVKDKRLDSFYYGDSLRIIRRLKRKKRRAKK